MKAWILSDIHLEASVWDLPEPDRRPEFDVLIVASDLINKAERGVRWLQERVSDKPVLYVLGNHEAYGEDIDLTLEKARRTAEGSLVRVLERESVVIGNVQFLGATLWTDYALFGPDRIQRCMNVARDGMNDHRRIRKNAYARRFMPEDARIRHEETIAYFRNQAQKAPGARRVIITHHCPIPRGPDQGLLSASYCSDLTPLMRELGCAVWVSGHVHESIDFVHGGTCTRLVANPKGYGPRADQPPDAWQNLNFDPNFTIDIVT